VLVRRFTGERAWLDFEHSLEDGTRSLRDVLQAQAALVRGTFADITALLRREIHVDPSFASFVAACDARGDALTIVSSGIEAIIRDRLSELGVRDMTIVANGVDPDPNGWRILFRDDVPNGTDKAALVRAAGAAGNHTIFIGDGRSDYEAALAADVRFAKRGLPLERYLIARGVPFEPFASFADVQSSISEVISGLARRRHERRLW
jgi:2-hydroxy-3-keto-5-methylthiopentenyl-1-phosphate phosphatase